MVSVTLGLGAPLATAQASVFSFLWGESAKAATSPVRAIAQNSQNEDLLTYAGNTSSAPISSGVSMDDKAFSSEVGPTGTMADVEANDNQGTVILYVVHKGDTIAQVAKMFDVSAETILWANNLTKGTTLYEGQHLDILPVDGIQYTVKSGDTIKGIVKKYKGDINSVLEFNDLSIDQKLFVGEIIIIPNGKEGSTVASSESTQKSSFVPATYTILSGYFTHPVPAATRRSQKLHGRVHKGVDYSAPIGTPVYAATGGKIIQSQFTSSYCGRGCFGDYGNNIMIEDQNHIVTVYGHLSAVYFKEGTTVIKGQQIGEVGNTGRSTGPHLHFEVRGANNPGQEGNGFSSSWAK